MRIAADRRRAGHRRGAGRGPPPADPQPGRPRGAGRRRGGERHGADLGQLLPRLEPVVGEVGADAAAGAATWERLPHWDVAARLGIFDLERGAKIAGSGFPVYRGLGSGLQRALISWFLDVHTRENGFTEIWPPAVVNAASARGTGQIPDKEDQMYVVTRDELYLVPTAEVPVTNLHRDEILDGVRAPDPLRGLHAVLPAGGRGGRQGHPRDPPGPPVRQGRDGPLRASGRVRRALEWMTGRAEDLLQRLGLAYRVLLMATRDMGFVQAKKYDLEVWAPGVERWLEVSSCSNFRDYQARRMAVRLPTRARARGPSSSTPSTDPGSPSPGSSPPSSRPTSGRTARSEVPGSFGPTGPGYHLAAGLIRLAHARLRELSDG